MGNDELKFQPLANPRMVSVHPIFESMFTLVDDKRFIHLGEAHISYTLFIPMY